MRQVVYFLSSLTRHHLDSVAGILPLERTNDNERHFNFFSLEFLKTDTGLVSSALCVKYKKTSKRIKLNFIRKQQPRG